jgi:GT2 family glycosyltransferase
MCSWIAMIDIAAATRLSSFDFWKRSALGQSLKRLAHDPRIRAHVAFRNRKGLPEVYNARINAADCRQVLVFMHDDVWIDDAQFADRVLEGLARYDVIGVAGNRRRLPFQPAWVFADIMFNFDQREHLSATVAHGPKPFGELTVYGDAPSDCELLDGMFMAARAQALQSKGVAFDPKFKFHLYDMDFCRSARDQGLSMGTWPVMLTHQSEGAFGSASWTEQYRTYLEKWGG